MYFIISFALSSVTFINTPLSKLIHILIEYLSLFSIKVPMISVISTGFWYFFSHSNRFICSFSSLKKLFKKELISFLLVLYNLTIVSINTSFLITFNNNICKKNNKILENKRKFFGNNNCKKERNKKLLIKNGVK